MNASKTKRCVNCHAEMDSCATECLCCGCRDFIFTSPMPAPEAAPKAAPKTETNTAEPSASSIGGKIFRVLAVTTWIGGFIIAAALANYMESIVGFLSVAIVCAISGCILYAQAELFDCVHGIYALLKESKQK